MARPALSLPAWTYSHPGFFELEKQRVFYRSWQIVCHQSDIPAPGDYFRFDLLDEPLIVVRDDDNEIRAYSNVCRHRGARLLDGDAQGRGHCAGQMIRCPYHAWTYDLDGRLRALPQARSYPGFDKNQCRLPEYSVDLWMGFVFVAIEPATPRISEVMAPHEDSLAPLRMADMRSLGRVTMRPRDVNWKNIVDNFIDGLHIRVAHPGLRRLAGQDYNLFAGDTMQHIKATLSDDPSMPWSHRMYLQVLPERQDLPEERRRLWEYFLLWPNTAIDIYPDQVDFMQMLPLSPTATLIREISYALPDASREMRLARYLNWRINRVVNAEDHDLVSRVQHGMGSRDFTRGPFSENETCLRAFSSRISGIIPVAANPTPPAGDLSDYISSVE